MQDFSQEFRISVRGLELGMFVAHLDRPWLGTDFPMQGFLLRTGAELEAVRALCSHCYVDAARGRAPDPRYIELENAALVEHVRVQAEFEAVRRIQWPVATRFTEELPDAEVAHGQLERGITEVMEDLRAGRELDLPKLRRGVEAMVDSITRNPDAFHWLKEIKRRDSYTYQHALSCSVWAASFGRHLGMDHAELCELALGGLLFDVGKTRLPESMLYKEAALDSSENAEMRQHVQHSLDILQDLPGMPPRVLEMVATHHERHDGSGYPRGLVGSAIPITGRILGLVDTYDALTTIRPHAPGLAPHQAVAELYQARGTLYQPELVEQFIQTCGIYPTGSLVELTDGQVGVVTAVHSLKRLRPSVMLLLDAQHRPLPQFTTVDLGELSTADGMPALGILRGLPPGAYGIDTTELFLD